MYEFQINISTNSREIKYRNMGIGLLHAKRRTRQMTSDRHQIWHTDYNRSRTGLYNNKDFSEQRNDVAKKRLKSLLFHRI